MSRPIDQAFPYWSVSSPINIYEESLKRFYMDKAHPLSFPMVVLGEELLDPKVPYLSAIGTLMYLANYTHPDIAFSINLLARYSSTPTQKHWNSIKHILCYLQGTTNVGLFYSQESKQQLLGYADVGYLLDPQIRYVFN